MPNQYGRQRFAEAENELKEFIREELLHDPVEIVDDSIRDYASDLVPVRYVDVLEWVSCNLWLGCQNPEFETASPYDSLQLNIAAHLYEIGLKHYSENTSVKTEQGASLAVSS